MGLRALQVVSIFLIILTCLHIQFHRFLYHRLSNYFFRITPSHFEPFPIFYRECGIYDKCLATLTTTSMGSVDVPAADISLKSLSLAYRFTVDTLRRQFRVCHAHHLIIVFHCFKSILLSGDGWNRTIIRPTLYSTHTAEPHPLIAPPRLAGTSVLNHKKETYENIRSRVAI